MYIKVVKKYSQYHLKLVDTLHAMQQCFLNHIMENIICKAVKDKNTNPGALTTLSKIGSTTGDVKAIKYCHNLSNITKIVLSITITIRG